ncbi:MAG: 5-aminolevulic acid synthase [Pseudomonadota bacterium]
MMKHGVMAVAVALLAGGAQAEPIGSKAARGLLFKSKGADVIVFAKPYLSSDDVEILRKVAGAQKYYAVVAAAPDEGLMSDALVAAANYHALDPARSVALEGCNRRRKSGSARCEIVAQVVPRGWDGPRAVQLNVDATDAFRKFRRGTGPRAFAVSQATGNWAAVKGADAGKRAVADCNAGGAVDCTVVIQD